MFSSHSTDSEDGGSRSEAGQGATITATLDVVVGLVLVGTGMLVGGASLERLDTAVIGLLVAVVGAYNLYRLRHDRLEHPDTLRAAAIVSLWLIAFTLSRGSGPVTFLSATSIGGGVAILVVNAVDFGRHFKNRPVRRAAARQNAVGLRSTVVDAVQSLFDAVAHPSANELLPPLLLAVPVGVGAGIGAAAFRYLMFAIHAVLFGRVLPLLPSRLWIAVLPVVGAAIAGALIYEFAPEAAGHGVPENMEAIANANGRIRHRLAPFKVLVSALTLGAGGSGGREGPIARIGAGVGSSLGQVFGLSAENTRLLLAAGIAGGIGATFGAILGGICFGLEIVMVYRVKAFNVLVLAETTLVAVVTAQHIAPYFPWFTFLPFPLPELTVAPRDVLFAAPYGILVGVLAWAWVVVLDRTERWFQTVEIPSHVKPAIGAIPVGVLGIFYAKYGVMGVGYSGLRLAVSDVALGGGLLLVLAAAKLVATQFTIGSGGSGGVFAPTLYIGGLFAVGLHQILGILPVDAALLGVVGMGAIFSGAAFAPLTAMFLIAEVFDSYALVGILAVPCLLSYVITRELLDASIYTSRLKRRGILSGYPEKAAEIGPGGSDTVGADESLPPSGDQSVQSTD